MKRGEAVTNCLGPGSPAEGPVSWFCCACFVFLNSITFCHLCRLNPFTQSRSYPATESHPFWFSVKIFRQSALAGGPKIFFRQGLTCCRQPWPFMSGSDKSGWTRLLDWHGNFLDFPADHSQLTQTLILTKWLWLTLCSTTLDVQVLVLYFCLQLIFVRFLSGMMFHQSIWNDILLNHLMYFILSFQKCLCFNKNELSCSFVFWSYFILLLPVF